MEKIFVRNKENGERCVEVDGKTHRSGSSFGNPDFVDGTETFNIDGQLYKVLNDSETSSDNRDYIELDIKD